jgi:hypothetical protein
MWRQANLSDAPVEDLIALLRKGRVEDLMLFFPMQRRNAEDFKKHFLAAELPALVQYQVCGPPPPPLSPPELGGCAP